MAILKKEFRQDDPSLLSFLDTIHYTVNRMNAEIST